MTQILSPSRVSFNPNMLHPSVEECRSAVAHVLSQPEFLGSNRLREFLRFVAERTLAGRGDTLKATAIAVAVFGRDETFDAHANPIVRVEATRLRKALRNYYEKRGANDSVEISLPVGSYAPVFLRRDASASMRVPALHTRSVSAQLVSIVASRRLQSCVARCSHRYGRWWW